MIDTECTFTTGEVVTALPTQVSQDRNTVTCTLTTSSLPISLFTNNGMDCLHTVEPVYYGHLGTNKKCPDFQGVLISRSFYMKKCHLGPQLSIWIIQVSIFSSAHINRSHCNVTIATTCDVIKECCVIKYL